MNLLEKWLVRRIVRREVRQSYEHLDNITGIFRMVREACEEEFTEDNAATRDAMMRDCLDAARSPEEVRVLRVLHGVA